MPGIIEFNGYKFWHHADVVKDVVWDFLEKSFPNSVIFPEFFRVDLVILNENIPVEIQSTVLLKNNTKSGNKRIAIAHSYFEQLIEKQIKQNIDNFGICWFFFDSEYLRYLQNDLSRGSRINLDWLYQFMKDNVLRVFTVSYDGIIREISCKDFSFLNNVSMTCKIGQDEDYRILDRNKFKIMGTVLSGYNFTSDELFGFREDFGKSDGQSFNNWLSRKGCTPRQSLFGAILNSISSLNIINLILDRNEENMLPKTHRYYLTTLGLFDVKGNTVSAIYCFADKFEIAVYFPGYERNKEIWDNSRGIYVKLPTLRKLVRNQISIKDVDAQKGELDHKRMREIRNILLDANGFSDDEIDEYRIQFKKDVNNGGKFTTWLQKRGTSKRQKLLGRILVSTSSINLVDSFFTRKENSSNPQRLRSTLIVFGIVESKGGWNAKTKFVDKYKLSRLFKGYQNNIEFWDSIKNKDLSYKDFWDVIYNKNKEQSTLEEFK